MKKYQENRADKSKAIMYPEPKLYTMNAYGGVKLNLHMNLALDESELPASRSGLFTLGERYAGNH
jgi:hypothetical protein